MNFESVIMAVISFKCIPSDEMWAGVLFFLFCVGFVFYVFEHINLWIQRNHNPPSNQPIVNLPKKNINHINVNMEVAENSFMNSRYVFKKVKLF